MEMPKHGHSSVQDPDMGDPCIGFDSGSQHLLWLSLGDIVPPVCDLTHILQYSKCPVHQSYTVSLGLGSLSTAWATG